MIMKFGKQWPGKCCQQMVRKIWPKNGPETFLRILKANLYKCFPSTVCPFLRVSGQFRDTFFSTSQKKCLTGYFCVTFRGFQKPSWKYKPSWGYKQKCKSGKPVQKVSRFWNILSWIFYSRPVTYAHLGILAFLARSELKSCNWHFFRPWVNPRCAKMQEDAKTQGFS